MGSLTGVRNQKISYVTLKIKLTCSLSIPSRSSHHLSTFDVCHARGVTYHLTVTVIFRKRAAPTILLPKPLTAFFLPINTPGEDLSRHYGSIWRLLSRHCRRWRAAA